MKPPPRFLAWTLLVFFSAALKVSHAQWRNCTEGEADFTTTTTTATLSGMPDCGLTLGSISRNGSLTNLTPGTSYLIHLSCLDCCERVTTMPNEVQNLTVMEVTTSSILVGWSEPEGESLSYKVEWTGGNMENISETHINISSLSAGVQHEINVTAVAADRRTIGASKTIFQYTRPGKIQNPSVSSNTTAIWLSWSPPAGQVLNYRLTWHDGGTLLTGYSTTEKSAVLSHLTPGVEYTITLVSIARDNQTEGDSITLSHFTKPAVVKNLSIVEITTSSVSLSWTPPDGNASMYLLNWTDRAEMLSNITADTSFIVINLTPGSQHDIAVSAAAGNLYNDGGKTWIMAFTRPEKPVEVTVTPGTDNLNISWVLPAGRVDHFVLNVSNEDLMYFNSSIATLTTAHVTGLHPGRLYNVTVTSVAGDLLNPSDVYSFATVPTPPGSIIISERTNSSLHVQWATPSMMDEAPSVSYFISYQTSSSVTHTNSSSNSTVLSLLSSGTLYNIIVQTVGPQSLMSTVVNGSSFTLPNPVLNLEARPRNTTSITVEWSDPQGVQVFYRYLVRTHTSNGTIQSSMEVGDNEADVHGLEPGTRYRITVATIAAAQSVSGPEQTYTRTKPKAVTGLSEVHVNTSVIQLTWIRQSDHKSSYSYLVIMFLDEEIVLNVTTLTETHTFYNLIPGRLYNFDVYTVVGQVKSTLTSATIHTRPEKVTDITVIGGTTDISVMWTPASGRVDSYDVSLKRDSQLTNTSRVYNTTGTMFEGLTPGVLYCVEVVTKTAHLSSSSSSVCNATVPKPPGFITVESQALDSVNFTWTDPDDMDHNQYNFSVSSFKGSAITRNNWFLLDELQPGTFYSISVVTVGLLDYKSTAVTLRSLTRPQKPVEVTVTPGTDNLNISWVLPAGRVDHFVLNVSNEDLMYFNSSIATLTTAHVTGLHPGRLYNVTVTSVAGDLLNPSDVYSFATVPTPPGSIIISERTNSSLHVQWATPSMMDEAPSVSYFISYQTSSSVTHTNSSSNSTVLSLLSSGTLYNIIVQTVGPQSLMSTVVNGSSFTFPNPVLNLEARPRNTTSITVEWSDPQGVQVFYRYLVRTHTSNGTIQSSMEVGDNEADVHGLEPGTRYRITVATIAAAQSVSGPEETYTRTKPKAVTGLSEVHVNTSVIQLTWIRQSDHKSSYSYLVIMFLDEEIVLNVTTLTETHTFYNLIPGRLYNFDVYTVVGQVKSTLTSATIHTRPEKVTDITVIGGTTDISVMWTPASGRVDSYDVSLKRDSQWTNTSRVYNTTGTTFEGLTPGVLYCVEVVTKTAHLSSSSSSVCNATVPKPPGFITVESQALDSVNFTWTDPDDMDHNQYNFSVSSFKGSAITRNNWFLLDELQPGTFYSISVVTVGLLDYKSTAVTLRSLTRPQKPVEVTVTPGTDNLNISWVLPAGRVDHFVLNVSNEDLMYFNSSIATLTTADVTGLHPGRLYNVTVTSVAGDLLNPSDVYSFATVPTPPGSIIIISERTNSSLHVQWATPSMMDEAPSVSYFISYQTSSSVTHTNSSSNSTVLSLLSSGTLYNIIVQTVGPQSLMSTVVNGSSFTFPNPVLNLEARPRNTTSITVEWSDPQGVQVFYRYLVRTHTSNGTIQSSMEVGDNEADVHGLEPGTRYRITVATIAAAQSVSGPEQTYTRTKPKAVTGLSELHVNKSVIQLTWIRQSDHKSSYSYLVIMFLDEEIVLNVTTLTETHTFYNLIPGRLYNFDVYTVVGQLKSTLTSATIHTRPEKVTDITVIGGTTDISVMWTPASGRVDSYDVSLKRDSQLTNTSRVYNTTGTMFEGLTPGVLYCVEVVTKTAHLSSSSSSVCNATVPKPPGFITVESQALDSVNFTWTDPDDMDHNQYNFSVSSFKGSDITRNNWFLLDELQPGTFYSISVVTVGLLDYKSTAVTLRSLTRPEKPVEVTVTPGTDNLNISWVLPAGRVDHFVLNVSNEDLMYFNSSIATLTTAHVTGLHPGRLYNVTVTSVAADLLNPSDVYSFATVPTPPGSIIISERTNSSLHVQWATPSMMDEAPSVSYFISYQTSSSVTHTNSSSNSTVLSLLSSGTLYNISVQTVGPQSLMSTVVNGSSFTFPNPVLNLEARPRNTTSITVEWSDPQGVQVFYRYLVRTHTSNGTIQSSMEVGDNETDVHGLEPGTRYRITVATIAAAQSVSGPEQTYTNTKPKAVTGLCEVHVNTSVVQLTWIRQSDHKSSYSYLVIMFLDEEIVLNVTTLTETHTFYNLIPGRLYNFDVYTVVGQLKSTLTSATIHTRPEKVTDITVIGGTTDISVMWTPASGRVDSYDVSLKRDSQWTNTSRVYNTTGTTFEGLTPGVLYCVEVVTKTAHLSSSSSSVCNATVPKPPGFITVGSQALDSVNFTWTDPDDMDHNQYNFSVSSFKGSDITRNNWFLLDELQPGTFYSISVVTVGLLDYKSTAVTLRSLTRPQKPVEVTVTPGTDNLNISWVLPAGRVDHFVLNVSNEDLMYFNSSIATLTTAHVTGLHPGRLYNVTVTSVAGDLLNPSDVYSFATVPTPPGSIIISERTNSSLHVQWATPSMMDEAPSVSYFISYQTSSSVTHTNSSSNSTVLSLLSSGTLYNIIVQTVGPQSLMSTVVNGSSFTFPNPVLNLEARPRNTTSITVEWSDPQGVQVFYRYLVRTHTSNGTIQSSMEVGDNEADVHGLEPGTRYRITVATIAAAQSVSGPEQTYTNTKPKAVTGLSEVHVNTSVIQLTWIRQSDHKSSYSYLVIMFLDEEIVLNVTTLTETHTFYNLIPGRLYNFDVYTVVGQVKSTLTSAAIHTRPEKVTDITVIGGTTDISVMWTPASGRVDSYDVSLKRDSQLTNTSRVYNTTGTMFEGLTPGVLYCVEVVTKTAHLSSSSSSVCNATVPKPPGFITVESQVLDSVNFTWTDPDDMDHNQYNFSVSSFKGSDITRNNWFLLDELQPGTFYSISVVTVGLLDYKSTAVTLRSSTRPQKPVEVTVTPGTDNLNISWVLPAGRVDHFVLNVSNEDLMYFNSSIATLTTAHVTGLHPGRLYNVTVTSVAGDLLNPSDVYSFATVPTPPGSIIISERTNSSLHVQWATPSMMDEAPSVSYFISYQTSSSVTHTNSSSNSTVLSLLSSGTLYNIIVQTVGPQSLMSTVVNGSSFTFPNPVLNLEARPRNTTSITVEWLDPQGVQVFYRYLVRTHTSNGTIQSSMEVGDNEADVHGLEPGTRYRITVATIAAAQSVSGPEQTYTRTKPKAVTGLSEVHVNTSVIQLTWIRQSDHKSSYSYVVIMFLDEEIVLNVTTLTETHTFYNLIPGRLYNFDVYTVVGQEKSTLTSATIHTRPEKVTDITVIGGTTDISVMWTPASGRVDSYDVSLKRDSQLTNTSRVYNTTGTTFEGLTPGVLYCVEVVTKTAHLSSSSSSVCNTTVPKPPGFITVESQALDSVNFTWTDPDDMDHNQYNFSVSSFKGSDITKNNWFLLDELQPGTFYSISVVTVGLLDYKSTAVTMRSSTRPEKPVEVTVTPGTDNLNISWVLPAGGVNHFVLNVSNEDLMYFNSSIATLTTAHVTGLHPGRLYNVTVTSVAGDLLNPSDVYSFATVPTPPGSIIISERTNSSLHVQWATPSMMDEAPSVSYFISYQTSSSVTHTNSSSNSTVLSLLSSGTLYNIIVQTVGPQSLMSTVVNGSSFTFPNPVLNLEARPRNTTSITVKWSDPQGVQVFYRYLVRTHTSNGTIQSSMEVGDNETDVHGLEPGTRYRITVATIAAAQSVSGPEQTYTRTKPKAVTGLSELHVNTSVVQLTWIRQSDHKSSYSYRVSMFLDEEIVLNVTTLTETHTFYNLIPGRLYNFDVYTVVGGVESTVTSAKVHTKPQEVTGITLIGSTTDMLVSWRLASGRVDSYSFLYKRDTETEYTLRNLSKTTANTTLVGLTPGVLYCVMVVTKAAHLESTSSSVCNATVPNPPGPITVDSQTVNSINFTWADPNEMSRLQCNFSVSTIKGSFITKNNWFLLNELQPGTPYSISVKTLGLLEYESTIVTTENYTVPQSVRPNISSQGSNSSVVVSWNPPPGAVEYYVVTLNGSSVVFDPKKLNNDTNKLLIDSLSAGMLYTAMVTTHSGPGSAASERVTSATFPNPPGPIEILVKTTESLELQWTEPALMKNASLYYRVVILSPSRPGNLSTTDDTNCTFSSLVSGTPYNITVATVGVMNLESEPVIMDSITTRPKSVKSPSLTTEEDKIEVVWNQPDEYKRSYRYVLTWQSSDQYIDGSITVPETHSTISHLVPGSNYHISITTETMDGTRGRAKWMDGCTDASPVRNITSQSPNTADAKIIVSWAKPSGRHQGVNISIPEKNIVHISPACSQNCGLTIANLSHYTEYKLTVETLGCGQPSRPMYFSATTGITEPTIPENFKSLTLVNQRVHNQFSVEIKSELLVSNKGPITHVGVLITNNRAGVNNSDMRKYLGKTYKDWSDQKTPAYLAIVRERQLNVRGYKENMIIVVGDTSEWQGYRNGFLSGNARYQYAIALFTSIRLESGLVDGQSSIVSITNFYPEVHLPLDPAFIGFAVGVPLGIFCMLAIILIGFIVYWRRLSKKESSDIQIHSLGAKISAAVRVEDFEAYYKQQKADSNCGFAEEFEDLKAVGTGQVKLSAINPENKPKNRYNNVLPYDSSRVKLSIISGSPYDDYINANYIPGYHSRKEFIAAQGPLPGTVNDFWRMIWEMNVQTVVMLTRCVEQGKVKCEQYWAEDTKRYANITVTKTSDIPLDDWTIREFDVKNLKTAETRTIRHFHFTAWPDHGVPETTELLISFRHLVREHIDQYSKYSPTIVHCSAGVGRTGTFITIDRLFYQIEREDVVDVYGAVYELRIHRPLMVQTEAQYVFLNQCALDIIRARTGTNVDLIYQNTAAFSLYENLEMRLK